MLQFLDWDYRRATIRKELEALSADVICLQELTIATVQEDFVDHFAGLGYGFVLQQSTNGTGAPTGNGIFYRKSLFLVDYTDHRSRAMIVALKLMSSLTEQELFEYNNPPPPPEVVEEPSVEVTPTPPPLLEQKESVAVEGKDTVPDATATDTSDNTSVSGKSPRVSKKKHRQPKKPKVMLTGEHLWVCNVHLQGHPSEAKIRFNQINSSVKKLRAGQQGHTKVASK